MPGEADVTTATFRAMATDVAITVVRPGPDAAAGIRRAQDVFERVERSCTRFVDSSPLMRANAAPSRWHRVPAECAAAVAEASRAHEVTAGVFDPRILDALVALGYDATLSFDPPHARAESRARPAGPSADQGHRMLRDPSPGSRPPWRPRWEIDGHRGRIHLDGARIDLGGIGKGLAVRWAAEELLGAGESVLVDAGGDCRLIGPGPEGSGWVVGVEDPLGGADPVLVLGLADLGCATSSVRLRHWTRGGRAVHHLLDPRTGRSGGAGLLAVTVVHPDTAWAEVWSKTLFLHGRDGIGAAAATRSLPAIWVEDDGAVHLSPEVERYVVWAGPRVRSSARPGVSSHG